MKLRFIASEQGLAYIPGSRAGIGQASHYIGRRYQAPKDGALASYPATEAAHEVDLDRTKQAEEQLFLRYRKLATRGDIWPADEETAKECEVAFVAAVFKDGEWTRPAAAKAATPAQPGAPSAPTKHVELAATVSTSSTSKRSTSKEAE